MDVTIDRSGASFLNSIPRKTISIHDLDLDESFIYFRFRKPELFLLFELLRFPPFVIFDNRLKMLGEEIFLRGLYELASGETQFKIARLVFGGDQSTQSRAFKYFINHVFEKFHHLLSDNLQWWYQQGLVELSALLIQQKMGSHVEFNEGTFNWNVDSLLIVWGIWVWSRGGGWGGGGRGEMGVVRFVLLFIIFILNFIYQILYVNRNTESSGIFH